MTTAMETALRTSRLNQIVKALTDAGEEVLFVGTNEITIPCVDADGNEGFVNVKVSVPRGTRNGDGTYDPYDGYAVAEFFANDQKEKAEKKKATEAKKAAKIAADKAKREAKAAKAAAEKGE